MVHCRKIAVWQCNNTTMIWTDFAIVFVVCMLLMLAAYVVREARLRSKFVARLSPEQREGLRSFETFAGDWRAFRDLSPRSHRRR